MKSRKMKNVLLVLGCVFITTMFSAQKKKGNDKIVYKLDFEKTVDNEVPAEEGAMADLIEGVIVSDPAPDMYHRKASGDFGIPQNAKGKEEAKNGDVYAGIIAFKPGRTGDNEKTYMCLPLKNGKEKVSLRKGLKYCVSYDVSLAESSKYAINGLGIYFSKSEMSAEAPKVDDSDDHLILNPTIGKDKRPIVKGFMGWEKVGNVYVAKGDEKFMSIGNFIPGPFYGAADGKWELLKVKKPKESEVDALNQAYYFVDNIEIKLIDKDEECECYEVKKENWEDKFSSINYTKLIQLDEKMSPTEKIEAHAIHYQGGKYSFNSNAVKYMDFIAKILEENPALNVEIMGHSAAIEEEAGEADEQYKKLDQERADAVYKYLVRRKGISETRLKVVYKGSSIMSPDAVDNDDDDVKEAKNRRVDFKVF